MFTPTGRPAVTGKIRPSSAAASVRICLSGVVAIATYSPSELVGSVMAPRALRHLISGLLLGPSIAACGGVMAKIATERIAKNNLFSRDKLGDGIGAKCAPFLLEREPDFRFLDCGGAVYCSR